MPFSFHAALDELAVAAEDLHRRRAAPLRLDGVASLACWGPLPSLPAVAPEQRRASTWTYPAPAPLAPGDRMGVVVTPAAGPWRGTVLLAPPWKIRRPSLAAGWARRLARCGVDVWMHVPPHHLDRTAAGERSGEAFASPDLRLLRASVEASVLELRLLAALAAARGPVGLLGLSLGALGGALAATAPEPLDFAALVGPPDLGLVATGTGIGRRYRRLARRAGSAWPEDAIRAALAPLDPARRPPTARRLLVAAGLHDRIAPVHGARALARAWGVAPHLHPSGHLSLLFLCGAVRTEVEQFVEASLAV